MIEPTYSDSPSDSSSEDDYGQQQEEQSKPKKYAIPARRGKTPDYQTDRPETSKTWTTETCTTKMDAVK